VERGNRVLSQPPIETKERRRRASSRIGKEGILNGGLFEERGRKGDAFGVSGRGRKKSGGRGGGSKKRSFSCCSNLPDRREGKEWGWQRLVKEKEKKEDALALANSLGQEGKERKAIRLAFVQKTRGKLRREREGNDPERFACSGKKRKRGALDSDVNSNRKVFCVGKREPALAAAEKKEANSLRRERGGSVPKEKGKKSEQHTFSGREGNLAHKKGDKFPAGKRRRAKKGRKEEREESSSARLPKKGGGKSVRQGKKSRRARFATS